MRRLEPWEQNRALNDVMAEAADHIDHANREIRYALAVMGALDIAGVAMATRPEYLLLAQNELRWLLMAPVILFGVAAVLYFFKAVDSLNPGHFRPRLGGWMADSQDYPAGLRYYKDVIAHDPETYWKAWQEVRVGQINAELAVRAHSLCQKADIKRIELRQLHIGLRIIAALVTTLAALWVCAAWSLT